MNPDQLEAAAQNERATQMRDWAARQGEYIKRAWGVEVISVRSVSADWMLNFSYRIVDPVRAAPLLERKTTAYLVDQVSGARLAVPAMENVGELRQTQAPTSGRVYYMIFGNADKVVKRGGLVNVVIGNFQANDLVVQ